MPQVCDVNPQKGFDVVMKTAKSEAATMVLNPGESTGGPQNRHENSDQWMYVIAGTGEIIIEGKAYELIPHRLVLIKAGEAHAVKGSGEEKLKTLNFYAPPEY